MAETEGDGEKRVCVADEESIRESEKGMAEEIGRHREPVALTTDLEDK
jgi:hypothetical protein